MKKITSQRDLVYRFFTVIGLVNAVFFILWIIIAPILNNKTCLKIILDEDRLIESMTAFLYLGAALLGFYYYFRKSKQRIPLYYLAFPILALFCMLEEISFGYTLHRWFNAPVIAGKKMDALHDFIEVITHLIRNNIPPMIYKTAFFIIVLGLIALAISLRKPLMAIYQKHPPLWYLSFWILFNIAAQGLDVLIHGSIFNLSTLLEELFELNSAFALFYSILAMKLLEQQSRNQNFSRLF